MFLLNRYVRQSLLIDTTGIHTVIEPIPEVGEAMLDKIFGGSEVEPRVDCSMAD
jgi:hypothetical protein